jgi:hypothetical protein
MVDVFKVKANIGKLERIRIGHDGTGFGAGWHLQDVGIRSSSEAEVHFDIPTTGRWFDTTEDDGQIERDLYPVRRLPPELKKPGCSQHTQCSTQCTDIPQHNGAHRPT